MTPDSNIDEKGQPKAPKQIALSALKLLFPKQLDRMKDLVIAERKKKRRVRVEDGSIDDILGPIADTVTTHRTRFGDPDLTIGLSELSEASMEAGVALGSWLIALMRVRRHALSLVEDQMLAWLEGVNNKQPIPSSYGLKSKEDRHKLLKDIADLSMRAMYYAAVMPLIIATYAKRKTKSGRDDYSTAQYITPAYDLMNVWHHLTGSRADSPKQPKGIKGPVAVQPSTEFVRLGFTMIDVKLKLDENQARKKAITAIRSVREIEKEISGVLRKQTRALQDGVSDGGKGLRSTG